MSTVLEKYSQIMSSGRLLILNFQTVYDYLHALKLCCLRLSPVFQSSLVIYLAAAVSDFYIPQSRLSQHKIQSTGDGLVLALDPVPKMLGVIVNAWTYPHHPFIISFKVYPLSSLW